LPELPYRTPPYGACNKRGGSNTVRKNYYLRFCSEAWFTTIKQSIIINKDPNTNLITA
jgi:hypothetical protein